MIEYLECDDLVEQDRDHINRVLFSPNHDCPPCKLVEFPFDVSSPVSLSFGFDGNCASIRSVHDAACSPTGVQSPDQSQHSSTPIVSSVTNSIITSNNVPVSSVPNIFRPSNDVKYNMNNIHRAGMPPQAQMFHPNVMMPMHMPMQSIMRLPHNYPPPHPFDMVHYTVPSIGNIPMTGQLPRANQFMTTSGSIHNVQGYPITLPNTSQGYQHMPAMHANANHLNNRRGKDHRPQNRRYPNNYITHQRNNNTRNYNNKQEGGSSGRVSAEGVSNSSSPSIINDQKSDTPTTSPEQVSTVGDSSCVDSNGIMNETGSSYPQSPPISQSNNSDISNAGTRIAQNGPVEVKEDLRLNEINEIDSNETEAVEEVKDNCVIDENSIQSAPVPHQDEEVQDEDIKIDNSTQEVLIESSTQVLTETTQELTETTQVLTETTQVLNETEPPVNCEMQADIVANDDYITKTDADNEKNESDSVQSETVASPSPDSESKKEGKGKTWASLFRNDTAIVTTISDKDYGSNSSNSLPNTTPKVIVNNDVPPVPSVLAEDDPMASVVKACLERQLQHRGSGIHQFGLYNPGNWCYVNASIQALIACPPLYHLLHSLNKTAHRSPTCTPILDALSKLICDYPVDTGRRGGKRGGNCDTALDAPYLRRMAISLRQDSFKGRQEDAQEFLTFLMSALHDEMLAVLSIGKKPPPVEEKQNLNDSDEWQQVGPGRKAAVTRQTTVSQSPLSELFVFHKRYRLRRADVKETTFNIEPFYMLPLEINEKSINDIDSAMQYTFRAEHIDMKTERSKSDVHAVRRPQMQDLPPVLILHLKYFDYASEGIKKLQRKIKYGVDLKIKSDILSDPKQWHPGMRKYKLFAVVFHVGEAAAGGHYISDVFHGHGWIEMEDQNVFQVEEESVLSAEYPRTPYLLFYRRCDLMVQAPLPRRNRLSASPAH